MNLIDIRVVKVGGSLFAWDDLSTSLQTWLERQPPMCNVLLAGGGEFADLVRSVDARFSLGEANSHWMCIDLLRVTSRLLAHLLPNSALVPRWKDLKRQLGKEPANKNLILDPVDFLYDVEHLEPGENLPATWSVSADSIAARVAGILCAEELVLLKSALPENAESLEALAEGGIVDQFLPHAAKTLCHIRVVNLRSPTYDDVAINPTRLPTRK